MKTTTTLQQAATFVFITNVLSSCCEAWSSSEQPISQSATSASSSSASATIIASRRHALGWMVAGVATAVTGGSGGGGDGGGGGILLLQQAAALAASDPAGPGGFNVDDYLRTGLVAQPMGVSGQAGKSRPETGVVLRDGSQVSRDARSGDVSAEILLKSSSSSNNNNNGGEKVAVLTLFSSPWPLATGTVFDVECRDPATGDGVFLAVTSSTRGKSLAALDNDFFIEELAKPSGRFSFYGSPTDIKVKKSSIITNNNNGKDESSSSSSSYRQIDLSFSTLSQSTMTEIPRRARIMATIPKGTDQVVMLVASALALRWKNKGADLVVASVTDSFRAIPAPQTSLKIRAANKETTIRRSSSSSLE